MIRPHYSTASSMFIAIVQSLSIQLSTDLLLTFPRSGSFSFLDDTGSTAMDALIVL